MPVVLCEALSDRLLRRRRDRVQDLALASKWSPENHEPIVDQGIHEPRVFIPAVLVAQIT